MNEQEWASFESVISEQVDDFSRWMEGVETRLVNRIETKEKDTSIIHSSKRRFEDFTHIRNKIERKKGEGRNISTNTVFAELSDLVGVRLLLLFQEDFRKVDDAVRSIIEEGDWRLRERAKAFTWDPEQRRFFESFDLEIEERETYYTSVHYLIAPPRESVLCCELQVRTLFEEIWAEIDHQINYPTPTTNLACREQLRVLSKIVGAGSRLADAIRRTIDAAEGEEPR